MKEVIACLDDWYADRPLMDHHNTIDRLKEHLCGEVEELCENGANLREELADVFNLTLAIFRKLAIEQGVDTEEFIKEALFEKMALNMVRYSAADFQEGCYEEIYPAQRAVVKRDKIKEMFYEG